MRARASSFNASVAVEDVRRQRGIEILGDANPSLGSPWPAAGPRAKRHQPCAGDAGLGDDDLVPRSRFLHERGKPGLGFVQVQDLGHGAIVVSARELVKLVNWTSGPTTRGARTRSG